MTPHKTTLNAPLTDEEYNSIQRVLDSTRVFIQLVPDGLPPEKLAEIGTRLVDFGFKLSTAVYNATGEANRRAFQPQKPFRRGIARLRVVPSDMDELVADVLKELS